MDFVHLHVHSNYSLLDSTNKIEELLEKTKEKDMSSIALTDHGNIRGVIRFYDKAKEIGVKPILGSELYVAPGSRFTKQGKDQGDEKYFHLVVLAKDAGGYRNLVKLSSKAFTEGFYYKPRVDNELLEEYSDGLIALSACKSGEVPKKLLRNDRQGALESARRLSAIFGEDDFFIELQDQGVEGQEELNEKLIDVAEELDLGIVATNDVHYPEAEDRLAHEVLLNIKANKKITDEDRMRYEGEEYYLKSPEEMWERFSHLPEAIENTVEIADRCNVELDFGEEYLLPPFEVPEGYDASGEYLRELVEEGAKDRWGEITDKIQDRIDHELSIIGEMGYPTYFLIVRDFIRFARDNDIPVGPGRGSAASSVVAYTLGITDIDPLEHELLFERFLNPGRVSMPDIDIDFCMEGRDRVIKYVVDKYGEDHVAQIATFDTMAARSSIRDVARVLDIPYDDADQIAKAIPPGTSLDEAMESVPDFTEKYNANETYRQLFDIARKLEGLFRNASTHAAGVVIAPGKLTNYAPLQRLSDGEIVTQYDMEVLEDIGLLKMDFLGLRNLTIIDKAFNLIEKAEGEELTLADIPENDEKTFELLKRGDTIGVFQLESEGMQGLMKRLEPEEFEDIIAANALYRPGPLESGMTEDYIKRKHGNQEVTYPHPELQGVLDETYGLPIYQEQIMQMAQELAGFSLPEADTLRVAMGKKKKKVMAQLKEKFIQGCIDNDISEEKAKNLFADIDKFSRYGFNKSHSTAYARISYSTAWLKANHSAAYMSSLLTSVGGNEDKVEKYIKDCEDMGIKVLPPDVNESYLEFSPTPDGNIRFGLEAVKYVGSEPARAIVESRGEGYSSFLGLCQRVGGSLNKEALESLIRVGAFDRFGTRKYLLSQIQKGLEIGGISANQKKSGQKSFFDQGVSFKEETKDKEQMEEFPRAQCLRMEKEYLGVYISGDPLEEHRTELESFSCCNLDELPTNSKNGSAWLAGRISEINQINTRKGDPMAFFTISDGYGEQELVAFPEVFQKSSSLLVDDNILVIKAKIGERNGNQQLIASKLFSIEDAWEKLKKELELVVNANLIHDESFDRLRDLVDEGDTPVYFKLCDEGTDRYVVVKSGSQFRIKVDRDLLHDLRELEEVTDVKISPTG
ncbi:DNA polymerase III subunit alpha [Candidatus Bipolaricaulota bacterium]|nr:DNA polymerase III subunit alpha [Candidatus Bipolaricaulota bacterium]